MNKVLTQNPDYAFMIEQAIKAPSGHNTQPWLFEVGATSIDILPDFTRSLPIVDPDNRELFISLGCATENLCITALHRGYEPTVTITKNGAIHIELAKQGCSRPSSLLSQINIRQTNRSIYNGNKIPKDQIETLRKIETTHDIKLRFFENGTKEFEAISEIIYEGNRRQMGDKDFKNELKQWMRYNKKHQDATRDGLSYAVFGAPNLPCFIAKAIMSQAINEKMQNKSDKRKILSSSHLTLLTTRHNTIEEWINLGRILEFFLLKSTEMGIVHAYMNQPNEVQELSRIMAKTLDIDNEYPTILLRIGYGKKMPYSSRKEAETHP
ncbi:nitroreductase [Porphyromonas sp.]|uniref:Acg family FMN-binding oxidoreductase n=1 Tax=Porphyromonas sp. TaxID=1924944 RepID=UPI0026DB0A89|nr:nitroreductase [Porphyromonas sp.]MDO4695566.1 nitroreductase [Porphyromonas sp.]MDO4770522.1 nitroreductase [Porphyromonas sp.]